MTWKDDALRSSLDAMRSKEPPTVNDSDLVGIAINRLQRAVAKMQAKQYDDELNEHLVRAGEMLGWVAENMWNRQDDEPAQEPATPDCVECGSWPAHAPACPRRQGERGHG